MILECCVVFELLRRYHWGLDFASCIYLVWIAELLHCVAHGLGCKKGKTLAEYYSVNVQLVPDFDW